MKIYRAYCLFRAFVAVMLGGCAIKPAGFGPKVEGIREAQNAAAAQKQSLATATETSRLTSAEIGKIKTLAGRSEGKADIILQWLDRQERKQHAAP